MTESCDVAFVELAEALADASGPILRRYFRAPVEIIGKPDKSLVTRADREAETAMRALIEARFPAHGIRGEEFGATRDDAEYVWVLDPIDGTHAFIGGLPLFGSLIALCRDGAPILGIVDHPATHERWLGGIDRPTTLNGTPVAVRPCPDLATATLYATTPEQFDGADEAAFRRIADRVRLRRYGTDCYGYAMVASGYGDFVVEAGLKTHDFMATAAVVVGAGGVMTDWQGADLTLASDGRVVACGDRTAHAQALALLSGIEGE